MANRKIILGSILRGIQNEHKEIVDFINKNNSL